MQLEHPAAATTATAAQIRPAGLVWDRANRQVFADLSAAMLQSKPVVALIGVPGSGKTALLLDWAQECRGAIHIARPGPLGGDADSVMAAVAAAFAVPADGLDKNALTAALRAKLTAMLDGGEIPVLMIDDADKLDANTVELLRLFSSIRHNGMPLMRLILAGRPGLRGVMKLDDSRAAEATTVLQMPTLDSDAAEALAGRVIREMTAGQAQIEPGVTSAVARHGPATPGALRAAAEKIGRAARDGGWARISAERAGQLLAGGAAAPKAERVAQKASEPVVAPGADSLATSDVGGVVAEAGEGAVPTAQFDTPQVEGSEEVSQPKDVSSNGGVLPKSIREAEDPRTLLRWAFGLKSGEGEGAARPIAPPHAVAEEAEEPVAKPVAPAKPAPTEASEQEAAEPPAPTPALPPVAQPAAKKASEAPAAGLEARMPRFGAPSPEALSGQLSARNRPIQHLMEGNDADEMRFPQTDEDLNAALNRVVAAERAERTQNGSAPEAKAAPVPMPAPIPEPMPASVPASTPDPVPAPEAKAVPAPIEVPAQPLAEMLDEAMADAGAPLAGPELGPAPATLGNPLGTTPDGGRIIGADLPPLATHRPDDIQERHERFDANEQFLKEAFALPEERSRSANPLYFAGAFAAGLAIAFVGWPMLRSALDGVPGQVATVSGEGNIAAISLGTAGEGAPVATDALPGPTGDGPALTAIIEDIKSPNVDERVVVSNFASLDGTGVRVPDQSIDPPVLTAARTPERLSGPDIGDAPQIQPDLGGVPRDLVGDVEGLTSEDFAELLNAKAALEREIKSLATERDTIVSEIPQLQQQAATLAGQSAELDVRLAEQRAELSAAQARAKADVDALAVQSEQLAAKISAAAAELTSREADLTQKAADITRLASEAEAAASRRDAITDEVAKLTAQREEIAAAQELVATREQVAEQILALETQRKVLNSDLEASRAELAEQTAELEGLRGEVTSLTAARDEAAETAASLQAEVVAVQQALAEAEAARETVAAARNEAATALNTSSEEIAAQRGEAESELANITGALQIGRTELAALEETLAERRAALETPLQEIDAAEAKVTALTDRSTALEAAIAAAEGQLAGLTDGQAEAADAAQAVTAEIEQLTTARALVKTDLDAARSELSQMETRLATERAEMEAQLAGLTQLVRQQQADLDNKESAAGALEARLVELADQTAAEEERFEAQRAQLDGELAEANARLEAARAAADEETARLTATISEVDALAAKRAEALAALRDAEANTQQVLTTQEASLSAEQEAVAAEIVAARDRLAVLTQNVAVQEGVLSDAASQKSRLEADIAALKDELGTLDSSAAQQAETLDSVVSEKSALESDIAGLRSQLGGLQEDAVSQLAALKKAAEEKAGLEAELAALRSEIADGSEVADQKDATLAEIAQAQETLAALRAEIALEEARKASLAQEVAERAAVEVAPVTSAVVAAPAALPRSAAAERVGRDADLVRDALVGLPELDKLSAGQRQQLEAELVGGACLTEALETSVGRINRLMLAGLMRNLDMCTR